MCWWKSWGHAMHSELNRAGKVLVGWRVSWASQTTLAGVEIRFWDWRENCWKLFLISDNREDLSRITVAATLNSSDLCLLTTDLQEQDPYCDWYPPCPHPPGAGWQWMTFSPWEIRFFSPTTAHPTTRGWWCTRGQGWCWLTGWYTRGTWWWGGGVADVHSSHSEGGGRKWGEAEDASPWPEES